MKKNIESLKNILEKTNWDQVYAYDNVNTAYKLFFEKFKKLYDICCPMTKSVESTFKNKPWLTKDIVYACHKNNYMYKCYLYKKNENARQRYLIYKNKLTSILRKAEKKLLFR